MKIIEEVRAISSQKIAENQKNSENNYPRLIEKIKRQAFAGFMQCQFDEHQIDQYSKRLLEADGFRVYTTVKYNNRYKSIYSQDSRTVWIVSW